MTDKKYNYSRSTIKILRLTNSQFANLVKLLGVTGIRKKIGLTRCPEDIGLINTFEDEACKNKKCSDCWEIAFKRITSKLRVAKKPNFKKG